MALYIMREHKIPTLMMTVFVVTILSACSSSQISTPLSSEGTSSKPESTSAPAEVTPIDDNEINPTPNPEENSSNSSLADNCEHAFENVDELYINLFWSETNFCKYSIDPNEIFLGIVPKDGIPSIDNPIFEIPEDADKWLGEDWPVMWFEHNGDSRAYPLAILIWHEIVNDIVGGKPVALTFCPLCNATIAFDRTLSDGTVLEFGTTGNLRNSDLVMYDRLTESWWQQFTGEAILGDLTGTKLTFLPSQIISWGDFKANRPDGEVLSRETGNIRSYGENPYPGYDSILSNPWFPGLAEDDRLPAMERVVAIQLEGQAMAYPFSSLAQEFVVNDVINGEPIIIFWKEGTRTTFGVSSTDVGSSGAFSRQINGQVLTFTKADTGFEDQETGTFWNILGEGIEGPLAGEMLKPIVSGEHFWFAWSVFIPDSQVWEPENSE
jgi:hypothetical protein